MPASHECYCATYELICSLNYYLHQNAAGMLCRHAGAGPALPPRTRCHEAPRTRVRLLPAGPTLSQNPPEAPQSASLRILSRKNIYTLPSFRKLQVFNKCELASLFRRVEKLISAKALSPMSFSVFTRKIPIFNKCSSVLGYFLYPAVFPLFPGQLPQP